MRVCDSAIVLPTKHFEDAYAQRFVLLKPAIAYASAILFHGD